MLSSLSFVVSSFIFLLLILVEGRLAHVFESRKVLRTVFPPRLAGVSFCIRQYLQQFRQLRLRQWKWQRFAQHRQYHWQRADGFLGWNYSRSNHWEQLWRHHE